MNVPMEHGILLAAILFCIGLAGLLLHRNVIYMLMSVEVMLNSGGLAFIVAGSRWAEADGQVMFIFILTLAAAEVAVALALMLQAMRHFRSLDIDLLRRMRG